MERFYEAECNPKLMSPLSLAFVGDAVFELFVRERLVCRANRPVRELHGESIKQVCCRAQRKAAERILPVLTQEETEIMKRGRNAHTNHLPKNSNSADYHAATAFETLFGYLYLSGQIRRLRELFDLTCENL